MSNDDNNGAPLDDDGHPRPSDGWSDRCSPSNARDDDDDDDDDDGVITPPSVRESSRSFSPPRMETSNLLDCDEVDFLAI
jgi:hypothetical protein